MKSNIYNLTCSYCYDLFTEYPKCSHCGEEGIAIYTVPDMQIKPICKCVQGKKSKYNWKRTKLVCKCGGKEFFITEEKSYESHSEKCELIASLKVCNCGGSYTVLLPHFNQEGDQVGMKSVCVN